MGFVAVHGHAFCLTDAGQELLAELGGPLIKETKEHEVKRIEGLTPESTVEKICTKLKETDTSARIRRELRVQAPEVIPGLTEVVPLFLDLLSNPTMTRNVYDCAYDEAHKAPNTTPN
jgi:hypothetical protein